MKYNNYIKNFNNTYFFNVSYNISQIMNKVTKQVDKLGLRNVYLG